MRNDGSCSTGQLIRLDEWLFPAASSTDRSGHATGTGPARRRHGMDWDADELGKACD